jgi:hypothetical protein
MENKNPAGRQGLVLKFCCSGWIRSKHKQPDIPGEEGELSSIVAGFDR